MPFVINGRVIKAKDDYLKKGARTKLNLSIRKDLKTDLENLSQELDKPISVLVDVMVELLQSDNDLLIDYIDRVRKY